MPRAMLAFRDAGVTQTPCQSPGIRSHRKDAQTVSWNASKNGQELLSMPLPRERGVGEMVRPLRTRILHSSEHGWG